jgi:hypothetical protein
MNNFSPNVRCSAKFGFHRFPEARTVEPQIMGKLPFLLLSFFFDRATAGTDFKL